VARSLLDTLFSGDTEQTDVVGADSLRFTTAAGYASAVTAVLGGLLPVLDKVNVLDVSENIKIAMIALVGAGVISYAIASAGDVLARAYATAHVHPASGTAPNAIPPKPIAEYITDTLLAELKRVAPVLKTEVKDATTALRKELNAAAVTLSTSPTGTIFPMTEGVEARYKSSHVCKVFALRRDEANPTRLEYLLAQPGEMPEWKPQDEVEVA
jgi:hypothetical protein